MLGKVLLNVLYNLAILLFIFFLIWSINHRQYALSAASVFLTALFIFLKLRLIKEVRASSQKRK